MYAMENTFRDTEGSIAALVARFRCATTEDAVFVFEHPPDGIFAQRPHLGNLSDRVVQLQCETSLRGVLDRVSAKGDCRNGTSGALGICNRGNHSPCRNPLSDFILKLREDSYRPLTMRRCILLCIASCIPCVFQRSGQLIPVKWARVGAKLHWLFSREPLHKLSTSI
jgi:hypothetical protein